MCVLLSDAVYVEALPGGNKRVLTATRCCSPYRTVFEPTKSPNAAPERLTDHLILRYEQLERLISSADAGAS